MAAQSSAQAQSSKAVQTLEPNIPSRQAAPPEPAQTSSELIAQNIEAVRRIRADSERKHGAQHQVIERVIDRLARPFALYALVLLILAWIGLNLVMVGFKSRPLDAPPFYFMDTVIAVLSLLTTVGVLIVQARQGRIAEERAELELQVNLLAEQKIAKLIELVESVRRDSPFVHHEENAEVDAMMQSSDPETILQALEDRRNEPA